MQIIFFGSFQSHSVQVLQMLHKNFTVSGVVTTPAKPAGRHMELTPTEVEVYAKANSLPVYPLTSLKAIPETLKQPDFIVVAGYGKLIPNIWLDFPRIMPINMHASYLPYYRGAFPTEWALLKGEKETGITIVKMSPEFDKGEIIEQQKIPIHQHDTKTTVYTRLYDLGGKTLVSLIPSLNTKTPLTPQPTGNYFYARKITRADGFIPWEILNAAITGEQVDLDQFKTVTIIKECWEELEKDPSHLSIIIERVVRGFSGWPGTWTILKSTEGEKRLKILTSHLEDNHLVLDQVQLEGKKPSNFKEAHLTP